MSYELHFTKSALKEWGALDATIKEQFKKQLIKRLQEPHVPSARLHGSGMGNVYKIKLRDSGYRLVYEVLEDRIIVLVLAVARRDKGLAYELARRRR